MFLALGLSACGVKEKAELKMTFTPETEVVLARVDAEFERAIDTVRFGKSGKESVQVEMKDSNPGFYNVYYKGRRIIPLILKSGDKVTIVSDTLGAGGKQFSIAGSPETERQIRLAEDFHKSVEEYSALNAELEKALKTGDNKAASEIYYAMGNTFVRAKFRAMRQINGMPAALSSLSLLYNQMPDGLHLFEDVNDASVYKILYDSLSAAYPGLKYLPMLQNEYESRVSHNEVMEMLSEAETVGYYDIEMPDIQGKTRKLSELEGKTVLLYFYTFENEKQLTWSMDLLALYEKYRSRGFEIFQVSTDFDKTGWAKSVNSQKLPWINVCDSKGADRYLLQYNVEKVPSLFIINKEGNIVARDCFDNLEQVIEKNL